MFLATIVCVVFVLVLEGGGSDGCESVGVALVLGDDLGAVDVGGDVEKSNRSA